MENTKSWLPNIVLQELIVEKYEINLNQFLKASMTYGPSVFMSESTFAHTVDMMITAEFHLSTGTSVSFCTIIPIIKNGGIKLAIAATWKASFFDNFYFYTLQNYQYSKLSMK